MRTYCSQCQYPQGMCLCSHIRMHHNHTPILVLQHPKEKKHALNTIHIASRCLSNIEVRHTPIEDTHCAEWIKNAALLFPQYDAQPLPKDHKGPVLILDATWPKAQSMRLGIPSLCAKICYHLPLSSQGEYRIRKAPKPHALSSLEAIADALEYLEHTPMAYEGLRNAFRARIRMQIQHIDSDTFHKNYPQER